ncbi:MAG: hypothetical protein GX757_12350 [Clostridiales bacterium]|nr:hypothetical protein [Clostridiales bacterium]
MNRFRRLMNRQVYGIGIIEIILILVVIIGLVLIFRNQIEAIIQSAFSSISSDAGEITRDITVSSP